MGAQVVGKYPDKYGPEISVGKEPVEIVIFTNRFNVMSRQSPREFQAEGWIYGPPLHWWHLLVTYVLRKCETSL